MAIVKSHEVFTRQLAGVHSDIICLTKYTGCDDIIKARHKCGHVWNARPNNLLKGHGCPACKHPSAKKTHAVFAKELKIASTDIKLLGKYTNAKTKVRLKHKCGHVWMGMPNTLLSGHGCPVCKNKLKWVEDIGEFVRGFEPQAIRYIIRHKLAALAQIQVKEIKPIVYNYAGKTRRYYPDFVIKRQNRIIEVKSLSTMGLATNFYGVEPRTLFAMLKAKRKACVDQGFKFTLLLMKTDGTRVSLPRDWHEWSRTKLLLQI